MDALGHRRRAPSAGSLKLYLDASAMVKLLVEEEGSETAALLVDAAAEVLAAGIGYVEARSALGRAARTGRLSRPGARRARSELEAVWDSLSVVGLDLELVALSGDVAEASGPRAGDAVHLTAALALDEPELVFACWDDELRLAAEHAGLSVAP